MVITSSPVWIKSRPNKKTDDELTKKELKQVEVDDQAIQTILLGLPEDIYAAVDSCETAQEIWLRVQQMMKGSDIRIQKKKAKLFNEWERFTSTDGELIVSYYHHFSKLMNDFKRNKHFPEKIASNLKFLNNLQPEWSRHVTIVHQTKDLHTTDYTQLYDFLKYNQNEIAQSGMNMGQDRHMLIVGGNGGNQFRQNQVIQNAVQNPGVQNVGNQKGLIVVSGIANQNPNGNGNVVAARAEDPRGEMDACLSSDSVIDCSKWKNRQEESTLAEEFDLMAAAADLDEIEEMNQLSVEQSGGTLEQHPATPDETRALYDSLYSNLATEVEKVNSVNQADESLAKHKALELEFERLFRDVVSQDIMSIVQNPSVVDTSNLQTELERTKERFENYKLHDTIYENAKLRAQLFDKVSEQKHTNKGTSLNTQFSKQSILGKPPSSFEPKLYSVTPFPKSTVIPKVGKSNDLSKPITSNSAPSSQDSTVVNNERVIAPGIFRINPFKASRKHKENVKKLKKSGSKESLASPSKPRSFLRWLPTGRIFDFYGKITSSSNIKSESDRSVCDNASASNPQEPTNKGFPSSTSFLDRFTRLPRQNICIHPLVVL
ncbi:hypothetical protein Tco_1148515 [Tanacetum coccineum]